MSLALARTHAPGQPEYVLAHSLWVERTPTCVSGRGSGRGEVALPAGVGLSKFGVRNRLWRMRQYEARLAQFEHPCLFFQRVDDLVPRSLVTSNHWQPRHAPCAVEGTASSTTPGCWTGHSARSGP